MLAGMRSSTPQSSGDDAFSATAVTTRRIPQLDGVRGIAILVVIFHNYSAIFPSLYLQSLLSYGWMGVDLFFVLSGFLITGILFDTKRSPCYFRNFYARRCLRIWPLYYSIILLMFVVIPFLLPAVGAIVFARSSPWWAYPLFLQNIFVHHSNGAAGPLGVTWSVAIEEQFYVVWAVVVRYCSSVQLQCVAVAVVCLSPALRLYLSLHQVEIYTNVFCRMDGLMAGGLIALWVRSDKFTASRFVPLAWFSLAVSLPLAFLTEALEARWITFSLSALASAAFVYLALFAAPHWFRIALASRWLIYIGTISYGLYLLHKIPLDVALLVHFNRRPFLSLLMGFAASFALAVLSWNLLETPFLRFKRVFGSSPLAQQQS